MSEHDHSAEHHEEHSHTGLFMMVFVALCALTTISFLTYFDWWRESVSVEMSRLVMMAVSCTKAMLVIMFFMHLKWEANWKWVLTAPVIFMSALLVMALVPDVGLRMRHASHDRMIYAAERPAEEEAHADGKHEEGHGDADHEHEGEAKRTAA